MQSAYGNGKFYFFTRNLTSDITVEELLHPFIYTVKEINPELFKNLLKEALLHYPKLNTKIHQEAHLMLNTETHIESLYVHTISKLQKQKIFYQRKLKILIM